MKMQSSSQQEMSCSNKTPLLCCPSCLSQWQGSPSFYLCLPRLVSLEQVGPSASVTLTLWKHRCWLCTHSSGSHPWSALVQIVPHCPPLGLLQRRIIR